ncbi:spindle assembly checkpoint component Mad1 [Tuber brumale]|nr:spindle assembly checkpoint component Mad1 [Tuber brumale]
MSQSTSSVQPSYDFLAQAPSPAAPPRQRLLPVGMKAGHSTEDLRSELNTVRYELSTLQDERELERIRHEKELRVLEAKCEEQAKRADSVESDKTYLFNRQKELSEKLEKVKDQATNQKVGDIGDSSDMWRVCTKFISQQDLERQIRRLKSENIDLKEQVSDKEGDIQSQDRQHRRHAEELRTRNESLEKINSELKGDLETKSYGLQETETKLATKETKISNLETELLRVKAQTGDLETLKILKKELSEQVTHIRTLESTNRKLSSEVKQLRDYNKSIEILEEEKQSLEVKVRRLDEVGQELAETQLRVSILQDEKNSWGSFFESEGLEFDSPESLARALIQERLEKASLLEQAGRTNPELVQKETLIEELEANIRSLREELEKMGEAASRDAKARTRLERQRALALKEAQFLREQLQSFSTEETTYMQGNYDEQKTKRIEELEKMLEKYKKEGDVLVAELAKREGADTGEMMGRKRHREEDGAENERNGELVRKNRHLQDEIIQLRNTILLSKKEIDSLHIRLESLEKTSTRILQLKDNPTSREEAIKVATLDSLRKENAALLAQVEERTDQIGKVVPIHTLSNLRGEMEAMEKVIGEKEKRMTRLKEIWTAKSLEFREAVYSLLGYKLDFLPNGRVRVTHMFAGNEDQSIEFDGEKGTMKVAGGPDSMFHREIKNQCSFWMARQSIPCLLASILIEQYEKTTRAQRM